MTNKKERPRPRVLMVAFACSPDHGSEWANGWHRAVESAKNFDTWVICQADEQKREIQQYLETQGSIPGLHFEFISYRNWQPYGTHARGLSWLTYNWWHRKAYRAAKRLHAELHFDLVHQVTNTGYREPGYTWKLEAPFVWGPIGGTHNLPARFLPTLGRKQAILEAIRSVTNRIQLYGSLRGWRAARRARVVLAANSSMRDEFARARGVTPLVMLDVGIPHVAERTPVCRTSAEPIRILWSGQFMARKALPLLLEALAQLPDDVRYELRVLGNGSLAERWKALAESLGIAPHVQWLGWLPHAQARQQNEWADVFVFTSLRDNSGTVVLEALAHGVPVIGLDHQGLRDMVTDRCGIKVPVHNPVQVVDDLAAAVDALARDRGLRAQMSHAALARARDYQWSALGEQMADIYCSVLADAESQTTGESTSRESLGSAGREPSGRSTGRPPVRGAGGFRPTSLPRAYFRTASTWATTRTAVMLQRLLGERAGDEFAILMYHRVSESFRGVAPPTWNVTPERLREQLSGLIERGFQPWSLRKLLEARRSGKALPKKVFAVTFDDGYANNFLEAWPILDALRVPATVFLATAYLDTGRPFPFDDWSAAGSNFVPTGSWRPLTTEECRQMQAGGLIELGAHTHAHESFVGRVEEFRRDMAASLDVLGKRFGVTQPTFAFPFGATSPELIDAARHAGVTCALTTYPETNRIASDPFQWGRFEVSQGDDAVSLSAKMTGWYGAVASCFRPLKRPMRGLTGLTSNRKRRTTLAARTP